MIAYTWVLELPRNTDMAEIRAVAERLGDSLADADGLLAGLVGINEAGHEGESRNAFALLSVWANTSRMNAFIWGDAMASVEHNVTRPSGRLWSVSSVQMDRGRLLAASHAGLDIRANRTYETLADAVDAQQGSAARAMVGRSSALACRGLDPATWERVSIDAWSGRPRDDETRVFRAIRAVAPERS